MTLSTTDMASQVLPMLFFITMISLIPGYSFGQSLQPGLAPLPSPRLTLTIHTVPVLLGERLTLQCNVWNRFDTTPTTRQDTVWFKDAQYFDRSSMIRTTVPDNNLVVDTLTINPLLPEDLGNYTCELWQLITGGESEVLLSESISLQAQETTVVATPECSPSETPLRVSSGDVFALECHVDLVASMISHNLYWTGGETNQIYVGVTVIDTSTHTAKMVLNFIMKEDYQNTSFVCHVNQTDGDEIHYRTCTVGPFFVLSPSTPTSGPSILGASTILSTTQPKPTSRQKTTKKKSRGGPDDTPYASVFHGYIFIIIVIAAMLIFICTSCFACWLCCCRKERRGHYSFRERFSSRRKLMKNTSAAELSKTPPHIPRRSIPEEFESPYYSSVGGGALSYPRTGGVRLPYAARSAADGASYTALQLTGNNSNSTTTVERPRANSAANMVDDEGYNLVGIGTITDPGLSKDSPKGSSSKLDSAKISSSPPPPAKDLKSPNGSPSTSSWRTSSLRRGFSLNSLGRRSLSRSRPTTPVGTPVDEAMPVYKTLMRPDDEETKTKETPYYLSVFPPTLNAVKQPETAAPADDIAYEVSEIGTRNTTGTGRGGIVKSSTVPTKSRGGAAATTSRNLERKGHKRNTAPASTTKVGDDGYLCPTPRPTLTETPPKLSSSTSAPKLTTKAGSEPRFSNAMYNVFN